MVRKAEWWEGNGQGGSDGRRGRHGVSKSPPGAWGRSPESRVTLTAARRAPAPPIRVWAALYPRSTEHHSVLFDLSESSLLQEAEKQPTAHIKRLSLSPPWVVAEGGRKQPGWTQKRSQERRKCLFFFSFLRE